MSGFWISCGPERRSDARKSVDHRVQGEAVHEMRVGLSRPGCRTRPQTAGELRRLRAVVGSVLGNGAA